MDAPKEWEGDNVRRTTSASLLRWWRATPVRLGVAAVLLVAAIGAAPAHAARRLSDGQQEAVTAMARLDADFYDSQEGLYKVRGGAHEPEAALWPTSQVLAAAIAVAKITHAPADLARVRRIIASLSHFVTPEGVYHARVIRSLRYYDDNNWVGLDLLDAAALLHDSSLVAPAKRIFSFLISGWDAKQGGGVFWADGHPDRPTVSTAPGITLGVRLSALDPSGSYREWPARFYAWMNSRMRGPQGLYWDHIQYDGQIDKDLVSYNQGVMIDANVAYAVRTGQRAYIEQARRIAAATAIAFPGPWRNRGNYAAFDAIYFVSLAHLSALSPGATNLAPARDYVRWERATAAAPRLARLENELLEQAAFVQTAAAVGD